MIKVVSREVEGQEKKPTRYFSKRQENSVAKAIGGSRTANSGAGINQKGDVLTEGANGFILECKTKVKDSDSITVKKDWIIKNKEEAAYMGKEHQAVVINFGPNQPNYYIIEEYLFQELLEYLNNKED